MTSSAKMPERGKNDELRTKLVAKANIFGFCLSNYGVAKCCALRLVGVLFGFGSDSEIGVQEGGTRRQASTMTMLRRVTDAAQWPCTCNKGSDHMVKIK